jgi:hypothetical protein
MRIDRALYTGVAVGLATHVVLTVIENSPDTKVRFSTRSKLLSKLPQWRFFAPNPGVDNTHLMYRTRTRTGEEWGRWEEIPFTNPIKWYALVWNPGSRAPKALFDTVEQLRVTAGLGGSYDWTTGTPAYRLLEDVIRDLCVNKGVGRGADAAHFQFMILTTRPGETHSVMQPVLVSRESAINSPEQRELR